MKVVEEEGGTTIQVDHPDVGVGKLLLMEALGTIDFGFFNGLLDQLTAAGTRGQKVDVRGLNFIAFRGQRNETRGPI
jgi:hypothetical protein